MTNIVAFQPERNGRTTIKRTGDLGRILLFTGVRYIRDVVELDTSALELAPASLPVADRGTALTERLQA